MKSRAGGRSVRKIGVKLRSVRGTVPRMGRYESTLERDLMELIRFDRTVCGFVAQPLTIEYKTSEGEKRRYTPDGLIHYQIGAQDVSSVLYEVKHREDFRAQWKTLLPAFRAAKAFCAERGWSFCVFTEVEIRTPYLTNIKFLWPFLDRTPIAMHVEHVTRTLIELEEATPEKLLTALLEINVSRIELIPVLWHLVAVGKIGCNLDMPLSMSVNIWVSEE